VDEVFHDPGEIGTPVEAAEGIVQLAVQGITKIDASRHLGRNRRRAFLPHEAGPKKSEASNLT
jgi:hypothetical protein